VLLTLSIWVEVFAKLRVGETLDILASLVQVNEQLVSTFLPEIHALLLLLDLT
jgi:flagellar biosynthesis protein FliQ